MSTLGEVVEQVRHLLSGQDHVREPVAALAQEVAATDTKLHLIGPAEAVGAATTGILEVGLELMRPSSSSPVDSSVTLWPFGRGYRATRAASHPVGSEVRVNPQWPAVTVVRTINDLLAEMYPALYGVREHLTTYSSSGWGVDVPADAVGVISVWVEQDSADEWTREDRWYFNQDSTSTGRPLFIGSQRDGSRVRVVYASAPVPFDLTDPDVLSTDWSSTGLSDRVAGLMPLGVAKSLLPMGDVALVSTIHAAVTDGRRESGAGGAQARLLHTLFQQRLQQESLALSREHPIRVHRSR